MTLLRYDTQFIKNKIDKWNLLEKEENMSLLQYENDTNTLILKILFIKNDIRCDIILDGKTYVYVTSNKIDTTCVNLNLNKISNLNKIFDTIYFNINNINIKKKCEADIDKIKIIGPLQDTFNIFTEDEIVSKGPINYLDWKKTITFESSLKSLSIPTELLFSPNNIFNMIKKEIININTNTSYLHYLVPIDNNPYNLKLFLKFPSTSKLYPDLLKLEEQEGYKKRAAAEAGKNRIDVGDENDTASGTIGEVRAYFDYLRVLRRYISVLRGKRTTIGRNKADTLMRCSGNTPAPTLLLAKLPEGMIRAIDPSSASMELAAISEEKFESIFIAWVSAKKFLTTAHLNPEKAANDDLFFFDGNTNVEGAKELREMMEAAPPLSTEATGAKKQFMETTETDALEEMDQDLEKEVMAFLDEMKPPDADHDDDEEGEEVEEEEDE